MVRLRSAIAIVSFRIRVGRRRPFFTTTTTSRGSGSAHGRGKEDRSIRRGGVGDRVGPHAGSERATHRLSMCHWDDAHARARTDLTNPQLSNQCYRQTSVRVGSDGQCWGVGKQAAARLAIPSGTHRSPARRRQRISIWHPIPGGAQSHGKPKVRGADSIRFGCTSRIDPPFIPPPQIDRSISKAAGPAL